MTQAQAQTPRPKVEKAVEEMQLEAGRVALVLANVLDDVEKAPVWFTNVKVHGNVEVRIRHWRDYDEVEVKAGLCYASVKREYVDKQRTSYTESAVVDLNCPDPDRDELLEFLGLKQRSEEGGGGE